MLWGPQTLASVYLPAAQYATSVGGSADGLQPVLCRDLRSALTQLLEVNGAFVAGNDFVVPELCEPSFDEGLGPAGTSLEGEVGRLVGWGGWYWGCGTVAFLHVVPSHWLPNDLANDFPATLPSIRTILPSCLDDEVTV